MNLFTLVATLGLDTSDFSKNIGSAVDQGKKAGSGIAKGFAVVGKAAAAFAIAAGAAYVGVVKTAADKVAQLEQNVGAAIAVWGEGLGEQQRRIAMQAAENVGLSTSQYLEMSNKMGSLMQGMGFDTREAFALSTQAIQRTADVASIMNIPIENAMEAINGLAKGNFTMMDNLGVAMNETALANYALEQGIKKSTSKMSTQEKVALALQMYMDKTAYATGNFAKEAEGLAGATTILKASWANLLDGSGTPEDFGNQLVNYIDTYMDVLEEVAPRILKSIGVVLSTLGNRTRERLDSVGGIGGALRLALDWTLGQFNMPDSGTIMAQVSAWWSGQGDNTYERLKSVLTWTLGQFEQPSEEEFYAEIEAWWNSSGKAAVSAICEWALGELVFPAWEDYKDKVTQWWEGFSAEMKTVCTFFMDGDSFHFPTWADLKNAAETFWNAIKDELQKLFSISIKVGFSTGGSNPYTNPENPLTPTGGSLLSDTWDTVKTMWNMNKLKKQYNIDNVDVGGNLGNVTVVNNISSVAQNPADIGFATQQSLNRLRFGA